MVPRVRLKQILRWPDKQQYSAAKRESTSEPNHRQISYIALRRPDRLAHCDWTRLPRLVSLGVN